ncbi:putative non-ribosomal peptide synthetase [Anopheles sinensis]|uniref:Putative non-ribosomal peptide synthetase n=1 Tax=Anopheles sinensis TaxID=74873 RepID=A0A084VA49_ANOSI|nr:putative non-ribosomal peptide synthetase [Anopheles sinensis]
MTQLQRCPNKTVWRGFKLGLFSTWQAFSGIPESVSIPMPESVSIPIPMPESESGRFEP